MTGTKVEGGDWEGAEMGRRQRKAVGGRRPIGPHDLYGGGAPKREQEPPAQEKGPSPASDMAKARELAREMIRRHPGDKRVLKMATDLLVRAARAERYITSGKKEADWGAFEAAYRRLHEQFNPPREEPGE